MFFEGEIPYSGKGIHNGLSVSFCLRPHRRLKHPCSHHMECD